MTVFQFSRRLKPRILRGNWMGKQNLGQISCFSHFFPNLFVSHMLRYFAIVQCNFNGNQTFLYNKFILELFWCYSSGCCQWYSGELRLLRKVNNRIPSTLWCHMYQFTNISFRIYHSTLLVQWWKCSIYLCFPFVICVFKFHISWWVIIIFFFKFPLGTFCS